MTFDDLLALDTDAPVLVKAHDERGHVTQLAIRVKGEHPSRHLKALTDALAADAQVEWDHPFYQLWLSPDGQTGWITTRPNNAGQILLSGHQLILTDGFERELLRKPRPGGATCLDIGLVAAEVEQFARFLRQEATEERVCRKCGCTPSWGCDGGCDWVADDDAIAYPPRAGTLRWTCRLAMMLKEQIVMVTQGEPDFWGPMQAYPTLLALAGELLARPERVRHFVLVVDEHEPTRTHNTRIVFANNFPITDPQDEIQRLLPVAERALRTPGTRFARPTQAGILLAPPYLQPHLHLVNSADLQDLP